MTDSEKREKVIRGLEAHANPKTCETCAGEDCPYYNRGGSYTEVTCSSFLAADALALLKEQEPRVMTLEELQAIGMSWNRNTPPYLFVERRSPIEARWMSWGFIHDSVRWLGIMRKQNYGSKWRIWNLQSTPEQMRETKWEGDSDDE